MSRLILAAMALSLLGACGVRGDLERPPPLWGEERERYEQQQREEAARRAEEALPAESQPGIGSGETGNVRTPRL